MKKYTDSHEWIELENEQKGQVGISTSAQKEIGEVVYIEFPKIGQTIQSGEQVAVLESTKAAVDLYSPVSGEIVEINAQLKENIDLINQSPETEGWIYKIKLKNKNELESLIPSNNIP